MLREREKWMTSRGLVGMISFEGLDRHLFNPLHKLLKIITDEKNRSFAKLSNLTRLPHR